MSKRNSLDDMFEWSHISESDSIFIRVECGEVNVLGFKDGEIYEHFIFPDVERPFDIGDFDEEDA